MSLAKNNFDLKRLKSKNAIEHLFTEGEVLRTRHLIFRLAKKEEGNAFYAGVSVAIAFESPYPVAKGCHKNTRTPLFFPWKWNAYF